VDDPTGGASTTDKVRPAHVVTAVTAEQELKPLKAAKDLAAAPPVLAGATELQQKRRKG